MDATWLYDERRQVGTDYADESNARAYDANVQQQRAIPHEVDAAAQALSLTADSIVWEIGTGTGEIALGLAARCRQVYASDVSPAMLRLARQKATERGISNVIFEEGGFLSGFTPPWPVHGIINQLTLHHLPDFWKLQALRRIREYMKPNGILFMRDIVFPSGVPDYNAYFSGMIAAIRASGGDKLADQTVAHIREEYSTFAWVMEEMLRQAGFNIINIQHQRFTTTYTCLARQHP